MKAVVHRVVRGDVGGRDDATDRQAELDCEREVALVVRGDGHDRAGAVAAEHVIGDEDRDALAVDRVDRLGAQHHAGLLAIGREAIDLGPPARLGDVGRHLGPTVRVGQSLDERMLGGEDHERRPEERVRAGREHPKRVAARLVGVGRDPERELGALGPADPVRLLDADRFGPVESVEVQQLVRVGGRLEVPLVQVALLDEGAAAPAMPVRPLDLLASERPVVRAPVDRRLLPIGQARLQELQEEPLVPAVVGRVGGDDLGFPCERGAHRAELAAHGLDVRHRPGERVPTAPDGRVLGRQPEGIEADRKEHVEAVHPPVAGERIARGDDVPMPDVQVTGRIRVHRQEVVLGLRGVVEVGLVQTELGPARLPARLDGRRVVALDPGPLVGRVGLGHGSRCLGRRDTPRRSARGGVGGLVALVELRGLEPRTPCMPCRCSSS